MEVENGISISTNVSSVTPSTNTVIIVKGKGDNEIVDQADENDQIPKDVSYINGLHIFSVLGFCILLSSPVIILPQHDAIQFPEYWYELLITFALTYPIQWTLIAMLDNHFLLKIKELRSLKVCLILALSNALVFTLIYCSVYLFWTFKLGYIYPLPLGNFMSLLLPLPFFLVILWNLFPKEMKEDKDSRRKLMWFIWYSLWVSYFGVQMYNQLQPAFLKLPPRAQPILAIILPLLRFFEAKVLKKLLTKCGLSDDFIKEAYVTILSNVNYLVFVTILISMYANEVTTFCILSVDVVVNLYECYVIKKLQRKIGFNELEQKRRIEEKERNIRILALSEVVEILIPLVYTVSYCIAYYGPNRLILSNMRLDYWRNVTLPEERQIMGVLTAELLLFSVDFGCDILTAIGLWYSCKINILKKLCEALRDYWFLAAALTGAFVSRVSLTLISRIKFSNGGK